jgi:hypothetical protein
VRVDGILVTDVNLEFQKGVHRVIEVGKKPPLSIN